MTFNRHVDRREDILVQQLIRQLCDPAGNGITMRHDDDRNRRRLIAPVKVEKKQRRRDFLKCAQWQIQAGLQQRQDFVGNRNQLGIDRF